MAGTVQPPRARAGVTFALEAMEVEDGRVLVSGHWDGVRGLRFVRPTLVAGGREVLATLDHKPWAPDGDPWTAAFPWEHGDLDASDVALSVAPSVTVPLAPPAKKKSKPAAKKPAANKSPARSAADGAAEAEAEALRDELRSLALERDSMRAKLDEAVRDRQSALRTRRRMEAQRDEAFAARNAAERQRVQAIAERQQAVARRPEPEPADRGPGLNKADQVAIRIFGSIAAVCSVLLLATLLRLFF